MRAFPRSLTLLAACALPLATLTGCTHDTDKPGKPQAGQSPVTAAPTTGTPSQTVPATPTDTPTSTPATPADRLLTTAEVPGLNPAWHWQDGKTGPAGSTPFGICAKASLTDIGATEAIQRTYFPPDDSDDNAGQQIAEFPDAKTTALAWSVLKSWHDKCGPKAGALTSLNTSADQALWYLVTWKPAGEEVSRFEAIGLIRTGTRISVLRITNSAKRYAYPPGQEPMVAMAKTAAPKLG
jgi:hypothetical protein